MKLSFEYGNGMMAAELPDNTDIFIPGETVPDPPCIEQTWDALYAATLASIRNPIGMPPLRELAHGGSTVAIIIPDIVKGGNQPTSHRKVAIRACLDELFAVGGQRTVVEGAQAWNPVFDVTPHALINALVTERGVIEHPNAERLRAVFGA